MYRLLRPLLYRMDPERLHHVAESSLAVLVRSRRAAGAFRRCIARPGELPVEALGLRFSHPVGLAAGFDKDAVAVPAWWALGFSFAEVGTVTPRPQEGNPRPRMFRYLSRRALVNRMGFNNAGAGDVARRLDLLTRSGRRPPMPVGVSLGKNRDTALEEADRDYRQAAAVLAPHADYLAVNVSSPNTAGLRDLQEEASVRRIVAAVCAEAGTSRPVLVKVAPELEGDALRALVDASLEAGARGFIATNTLSTVPYPEYEAGGLSGRPLRELALSRVAEIAAHAGAGVLVVGCGGIDDAPSARAFLDAGARLVQLYSALVFEGPLVAASISRVLANARRG